jgi:hypothetical protein
VDVLSLARNDRKVNAFESSFKDGLRAPKPRNSRLRLYDAEWLHACCETYLYFADNRFCEKNIIDARYGHAGKAYIPVILDVSPDGGYELICFSVRDARCVVDRMLSMGKYDY